VRLFLRILLLGAAYACGALAIGWWSLPLTALAWGLLATSTRRPVMVSTVAAGLGWGALVLYDSFGPAFRSVAGGVGAVLKINGPAFVELSLIFPCLLAFLVTGAAHALVRKD
jgi:hypothetical protein